jgi:hypothetical protein
MCGNAVARQRKEGKIRDTNWVGERIGSADSVVSWTEGRIVLSVPG